MAVSLDKIAPGVYFKLIDLSEYVQSVPTTIGFIPIVSERGRDNQLIFTNARDFYLDFGEPNINYGGKVGGQGMYVAHSFLRMSDALYVVRVMPEDATFSNLAITANIDGPLDGTKEVGAVALTNINDEAELITQVFSPSINDPLTDRDEDTAVVFHGVGRGDWYNRFKIQIRPHSNVVRRAESIYFLDIYQRQEEQDWDPDTETFSYAYQIVNTFEVSFDPNMKDTDSDSMFVAEVINRHSRYIKCVANEETCKAFNDAGFDWSQPFTEPISLGNGSVGSLFGNTVVNGVETSVPKISDLLYEAYTGLLKKSWGNVRYDDYGVFKEKIVDAMLEEVHDTENYYFNIVMDAGYDPIVKKAIVQLVKELRQDCIAVIDNGDNITVNDAIKARQFVNNFNDFHTAMYEPYSKIYDSFTGQYIWITPVYHAARVICYNDRVSEIWYAPAGFNRGTVEEIVDVRYSASPSQRDQFYLNQINPIVRFNVGNTIWGQLTSQKRPSAMQDLNIVRLVLYIKRALEEFCKFYIFEQNDENTWNAIANQINKFLKTIQEKRGLYSFSVEVGATEYEIKTKSIHVNVTLNPVRTIEKIFLNFYII